jgi:hypothetical protein
MQRQGREFDSFGGFIVMVLVGINRIRRFRLFETVVFCYDRCTPFSNGRRMVSPGQGGNLRVTRWRRKIEFYFNATY